MEQIRQESSSGLLGWYGQPWEIEQLHRHNDIELNLVSKGELHYLIGGQLQVISSSQLLIFWAVLPHRIVYCHPDTELGVIHVPLLEFLRWNLPAPLSDLLLQTKVVLGSDPDPIFDQKLFQRWAAELQITPTPSVHTAPLEQHTILLLEIEARLRRQARSMFHKPAKLKATRADITGISQVQRLAQTIAEQHQHNLNLESVAAGIGLHPNYAMTLFRATLGLTMHEYLTQHRLAHAQRLLITSKLSILDVALEVGFNSLSRFYAVFKQRTGYAPKSYRSKYARIERV